MRQSKNVIPVSGTGYWRSAFRIYQAALDILFPRRCPVCGEIVKPAGRLICPSCLLRLSPVRPPVCKRCGKEIPDAVMEYCRDCMVHSHSFEYGIALLHYDETSRRIMAQIKYNNKREYLDFFGKAIADVYKKAIRRMGVDVIVPVPIHKSRRRKRGFNQAELLARVLGEELQLAVRTDILVRDRQTRPQKELSAADRLRNLSGAFCVSQMPADVQRILLVDDIYTTGSTIEACTRSLKEAGAQKVFFAVICITG